MPVTGHLFVGLATGVMSSGKGLYGFLTPKKSAFIVSVAAVLAYLPDVLGSLFFIAGWSSGRVFSHSLVGGICLSLLVAVLLRKTYVFSFQTGFKITLFSMLFHDLLDFFHSADRLPLWPFAVAPTGFGLQSWFTNVYWELFFYSVLYFLFLSFVYARFQKQGNTTSLRDFFRGNVSAIWGYRGITFLVVTVAIFTGIMREKREDQFLEAKRALATGHYDKALIHLSEAGNWPSSAKPGRVSYLEAQVYLKIGRERRAEELLIQSFRENPDYFWCILDLAMFYTSSEFPPTVRRRLASPYLERLKTEFLGIQGVDKYLKNLQKRLKYRREPTNEENIHANANQRMPAVYRVF